MHKCKPVSFLFVLFTWIASTSCNTEDVMPETQALPNTTFEQEGIASYYADKFEGRTTANGEVFRQDSLTAAHKHLPFGTEVLVTNLKNNKQLTVRINDRGPFVTGRIIDLSRSGAQALDFINDGIITVKIEAALPKNVADSLYQIINTQ
ncbi:MAG: septal ring lytic transglycosylase RlpA family protein [Bacteroidota bacterium]